MSDQAATLAKRLTEADERILILLAQVREVVAQNDLMRSRCANYAADLALARRDIDALAGVIKRTKGGEGEGDEPTPAEPSPAPAGGPPVAATTH